MDADDEAVPAVVSAPEDLHEPAVGEAFDVKVGRLKKGWWSYRCRSGAYRRQPTRPLQIGPAGISCQSRRNQDVRLDRGDTP